MNESPVATEGGMAHLRVSLNWMEAALTEPRQLGGGGAAFGTAPVHLGTELHREGSRRTEGGNKIFGGRFS